MVKSRTNMKKQ